MKDVQFNVYLNNVYVWFGYHESKLHNEIAVVVVQVLVDSVAVRLE